LVMPGNAREAASAREAVRAGQQSVADGHIEAEYIKNLQTQVYYLELETNYLREELRKASERATEAQQADFEHRLAAREEQMNQQVGDPQKKKKK
jgi:hypothetical protein